MKKKHELVEKVEKYKKEQNSKNAPVQLFKKFGEFNSVDELNQAAAGQLAEGDMEALKVLAKENGIDDGAVEDYVNGYTDQLAFPILAAIGRINVEKETFKKLNPWIKGPCMAISQMVMSMVVDEDFSKSVMQKGKRVRRIATLMHDEQCITGTDQELEDIVRAYYQNGENEAKKVIKKITERYNGEEAI